MLEELQEIVRSCTGNDSIVITGGTVLQTDLGINSFELIQMICEVEDHFYIEIADRALSDLKTIQDIIDYITIHASNA